MHPVSIAILLVVVSAVSVAVGRFTAPTAPTNTSTVVIHSDAPEAKGSTANGQPPSSTTAPTKAPSPSGSTRGEETGTVAVVAGPVGGGPGTPAAVTTPGAVVAAADCEARLDVVQTELTNLVRHREEVDGKPIEAKAPAAPRFASAGLVSTFQRGFAQSGVKGSVESVDCNEHPCIIFGRLDGDEAEVAKLEDSAVFAAYDDDIGVMLTWASGGYDDAKADAGGAANVGVKNPAAAREKPEEVSLFAFAFYGADEASEAEAIDRRIRTRTAAYWNASSPRE